MMPWADTLGARGIILDIIDDTDLEWLGKTMLYYLIDLSRHVTIPKYNSDGIRIMWKVIGSPLLTQAYLSALEQRTRATALEKKGVTQT